MPDIAGLLIGLTSVWGLFFMWQHLDVLSGGNVGGEDDKA